MKQKLILIAYLDIAIRPLALIIPKMSGYVQTFKIKGDRDKNNKLMSFCIYEKLLEKYKPISSKIEDLKNIKLKTKIYKNQNKNIWR